MPDMTRLSSFNKSKPFDVNFNANTDVIMYLLPRIIFTVTNYGFKLSI